MRSAVSACASSMISLGNEKPRPCPPSLAANRRRERLYFGVNSMPCLPFAAQTCWIAEPSMFEFSSISTLMRWKPSAAVL
jgi:hypothetical protein